MTTVRRPRNRVPMWTGSGLHPPCHNCEHRPECAAQQTSEHQALANIGRYSAHI